MPKRILVADDDPTVREVLRLMLDLEGHDVSVAADGYQALMLIARIRPAAARSPMKPLRAAVSLSLAPFDFPDDEVSVMCASHNAEPVHVRTVRSLLGRAGVDEAALRCPSKLPMDEETALADPIRR